jgi:hypothetical protein
MNFFSNLAQKIGGFFNQEPPGQYIGPGNPNAPQAVGGLTAPQTLQDQVTQTASQMNAPDPYAPSRAQRIAALLEDTGSTLQGGHGGAQAALQQQALAKRKVAELIAYGQQAGLSPIEMFALRANPAKLAEQLGGAAAKNREFQNLDEGHSLASPYEGLAVVAPKMGRDGNIAYTQTPTATAVTGNLPRTYEDTDRQTGQAITQDKNRADEAIGRAELLLKGRGVDETGRHNRADEGLRAAELPTKMDLNNVVAPIAGKIAAGGVESLTPGERQVWEDYKAMRQSAGLGGLLGLGAAGYGDEAAPAPGAKPAAAPAKTAPQPRPASGQAANLPEGAVINQGGVRYQKRNGQMVPMGK